MLSQSSPSSRSGSHSSVSTTTTTTTTTTPTRPVVNNNNKPILDIHEIIRQQVAKRSTRQLALTTYVARSHPTDKCCGANGLPVLPHSIRILGRFQLLRTLVHPALARYVDVQRARNERLIVVAEHYTLSLDDLLHDTYIYNLIMTNAHMLAKWTRQALKAFAYLERHNHQHQSTGIVHRHLHLRHLCVTPEADVKLAHYGLYYMTEQGECVDFAVANAVTMAPECFVGDFIAAAAAAAKADDNNSSSSSSFMSTSSKSDVWSLGVVLFQFMYGLAGPTDASQQRLDKLLAPERLVRMMLDMLSAQSDAYWQQQQQQQQDDSTDDDDDDDDELGYTYMLEVYQLDAERRRAAENRLRPMFVQLIKRCLQVRVRRRPTFAQLLAEFERMCGAHKDLAPLLLLSSTNSNEDDGDDDDGSLRLRLFEGKVRSKHLVAPSLCASRSSGGDGEEALWRRGVDEVYHLWQLAGGNCMHVLREHGRLSQRLMPVHKLPVYWGCHASDNGRELGAPRDDDAEYDETAVCVSLAQLRKRLEAALAAAQVTPKLAARLECIHRDDDDDEDSEDDHSETGTAENAHDDDDKADEDEDEDEDGMVLVEHAAVAAAVIKEQPLSIRESDIEYQYGRMVVFERYLAAWPYARRELRRQCRIDIPPVYRALTWAALLRLPFDVRHDYERIDTDQITSIDRQLDVDIPRCHQVYTHTSHTRHTQQNQHTNHTFNRQIHHFFLSFSVKSIFYKIAILFNILIVSRS